MLSPPTSSASSTISTETDCRFRLCCNDKQNITSCGIISLTGLVKVGSNQSTTCALSRRPPMGRCSLLRRRQAERVSAGATPPSLGSRSLKRLPTRRKGTPGQLARGPKRLVSARIFIRTRTYTHRHISTRTHMNTRVCAQMSKARLHFACEYTLKIYTLSG